MRKIFMFCPHIWIHHEILSILSICTWSKNENLPLFICEKRIRRQNWIKCGPDLLNIFAILKGGAGGGGGCRRQGLRLGAPRGTPSHATPTLPLDKVQDMVSFTAALDLAWGLPSPWPSPTSMWPHTSACLSHQTFPLPSGGSPASLSPCPTRTPPGPSSPNCRRPLWHVALLHMYETPGALSVRGASRSAHCLPSEPLA